MTTKKTGLEREKEATRGRLRYLERLQEAKEADEAIKQYEQEGELPDNNERLPDVYP
jgi:hypothetical protein